jgi:hypothetical protein
MSPKFINTKKLKRAEAIREVSEYLMNCKTEKDLNDFQKIYSKELHWKDVSRKFALAVRRIKGRRDKSQVKQS